MASMDDGLFLDSWVQEDQFQAWLVKVSNDSRRSYCRFCAIVLPANRGDLTAHGRTQTHISNAKAAQESGVPTGPISVQIVSNDEEDNNTGFSGSSHHPVSGGGSGGIMDEDGGGERTDEFSNNSNNTLTPTTTRRSSQKRTPGSGGSGGKYIKRYRPAWEEEEEFRDWLEGYPEDVQRAFCKACKAILRAHKHDLTCHARTARHIKKIQEYKDAHQGGVELFQMIAEDVVTIPQTKQRNQTNIVPEASSEGSSSHHHHSTHNHHTDDVGEIGIEIDTTGIFPDDGHIGGGSGGIVASGSSNSSPGKGPRQVIKLSKACFNIKRENNTIKPMARKRVRFTAADVVHAIESNEFTGYEILQIVKVAVPKL